MNHPSIPTATYRLQFHGGFTFRQAQALVPYLDELGVSHVYASPFFKAAPGSLHGYDIVDHNQLNPEVGAREDFDAFAGALRERGMGLIADFVPNHMGIAPPHNAWWMDVLEHGPASPYAVYFDIDWRPVKPELAGKVLLPILGDQYGRVLERGELKLEYARGAFALRYFEAVLPLDPGSTRSILLRVADLTRGQITEEDQLELGSIITALEHLPPPSCVEREKVAERACESVVTKRRLKALTDRLPPVAVAIERCLAEMQVAGDPRGYEALDALLNAQNYRLTYWRVAGEEINYRRFFDVNSLAAIRMELPEVFDATHRLIFELIKAGSIQGLRIDHVDGLYHPRQYLQELQERYAHLLGLPRGSRGLYLIVEKILESDERLRADWPVHGTTGYEFANQAMAVLIDPAAQKQLGEIYQRFIGSSPRYVDLIYDSKLVVMHTAMAGEVNVLGHMLNRLSETNRWYRDFTLNALTTAVREVIACFPVYRTYLTPDSAPPGEDDRRYIDRAINAARRRNPALERSVFNFLRAVLLPPSENSHPIDEAARCELVMKLQQCSGPITAKGVEDTAFYNYNPLVALNEVGGSPSVFGASVETFHAQNAARLTACPHSLAATTTHDTKRSEDVRARIAAIAELGLTWGQAVRRWQTANRKHKIEIDGELAPSANEEYLLYQTLLGSWPLALMDCAPPEIAETYPYGEYISRIQDYMVKALHEAKVNSSWIEPHQEWDQAARDFVAAILERKKNNRFLPSFIPLAAQAARIGAINSLAQTVLKTTSPGVPDFYQGNELWDFSLVDPDNRRPVDYEKRRRLLAELGEHPPITELLDHWSDGRIKLFVTREILRFRRAHREIFDSGSYSPVAVTGEFRACIVAYVRETESSKLLVCVPRLTARVGFPPVGDRWKDTALELGGTWRNLFTGDEVTSDRLPVAEILKQFPVAALVG